jgi:hypothetical protein
LPEHFVWSSFIQELLTLPELEYKAIDSPQAAGMVKKKQWKLYLELRRLTLEEANPSARKVHTRVLEASSCCGLSWSSKESIWRREVSPRSSISSSKCSGGSPWRCGGFLKRCGGSAWRCGSPTQNSGSSPCSCWWIILELWSLTMEPVMLTLEPFKFILNPRRLSLEERKQILKLLWLIVKLQMVNLEPWRVIMTD